MKKKYHSSNHSHNFSTKIGFWKFSLSIPFSSSICYEEAIQFLLFAGFVIRWFSFSFLFLSVHVISRCFFFLFCLFVLLFFIFCFVLFLLILSSTGIKFFLLIFVEKSYVVKWEEASLSVYLMSK